MAKAVALLFAFVTLAAAQQNWTHTVRIGGNGLSLDRVDAIVRGAAETNVFGIEVDNDIPGRYESLLAPQEKLKAIRAMAEKAHAAGNRAFVYVAALECITANADRQQHSFFKDHPDWVQRNRAGEPAMFGGGVAFWVRKGDEDVWISPYAKEWRKLYMQRIREIAATGIDGIWVDIPYWMTHFKGWEQSWASFDDATVAAFREKTGLDARKDFALGDFKDPKFLKWVDFRISSLTDFVSEIRENAKSANPQCMVIPEIYPGIEQSAAIVGADVYELYPVVDAIGHEYQGGGEVFAASKKPEDWLKYMIGMYSFRAFAEGKATWMLSYSWDKEKDKDRRDAMKNLFLAQVMAGANSYDAQGHVMSGSNDLATRKSVYAWIRDHERIIYHPRTPLAPVGVYFSPVTRNYVGDEYVAAFQGAMTAVMQAHREFEIVTPRTLDRFSGDVLIVPDARVLSADETTKLNALRAAGKKLLQVEMAEIADAVAGAGYKPAVEIAAAPFVTAQIAGVDGKPTVFLANFTGQTQKDVRVRFRSQASKVMALPYLGQAAAVNATRDGEWITTVIPELEKGAIIWCE